MDSEITEEVRPRAGVGLYLLGLLGFIPMIGFFAGLALIICGLVRYKNKVLVLLGIACMIISISLYSWLIYRLRHSAQMNQSLSIAARMQLNTIARSVELYKLQNGQYPENLKQALVRDAVNYTDPMLIFRKFGPGDYQYHYQRIGDKYTLFSVGQDGIPNTSDDIFPSLEISDSTKFGLIKEHYTDTTVH